MSALAIRGATVLGPNGAAPADVFIEGGRVTHVRGPSSGSRIGSDQPTLDGDGLVLAPGLVDVQCNGAVGLDLTAAPERLWDVAAALPRWGVTAWLPTIVSSPPEVTDRAMGVLAAGPPPDAGPLATPLGLHLEGPFLAAARKGAHAIEHLVAPDRARIETWSAPAVAMVTVAPELVGALGLIRTLVGRDIVVALGHSDASVDQVKAAVAAGASAVTHLFNGMAPLWSREPGLVGAALADDRLRVGLIVDLVHVHAVAVAAAHRALGPRLMLVSDATAALGAPDRDLRLGGLSATVDSAGVRLADGTLAGTDLSLDQAIRNLIAVTGCSLGDAVAAATSAPAELLGLRSKGTIAPGADADLLLMTPDGEIVTTMIGGEAWRS